jgi:hypothetical protein
MNGSIIVEATMVNPIQFSYPCPFCYSKMTRNGEPRKGAKQLYHFHGSDGDLDNRIERRTPHCIRCPKGVDIEIHITDNTKRQGKI